MTVYLWEIPENYPEKLIGRYERERSPDSYLLEKGVKLKPAQMIGTPIVKFSVEKRDIEKYDCLVNSTAIPLVNERLAKLLENIAGDEVQFFCIKIECTDGELDGYKILNLTQSLDVVDYNNSVYTTIDLPRGNTILGTIKKLILNSGCLKNHSLARDEKYRRKLFVSQAIYDAFKREKITGVWLPTPDEFYDLVHGGK